jgi:hypothetical protein
MMARNRRVGFSPPTPRDGGLKPTLRLLETRGESRNNH